MKKNIFLPKTMGKRRYAARLLELSGGKGFFAIFHRILLLWNSRSRCVCHLAIRFSPWFSCERNSNVRKRRWELRNYDAFVSTARKEMIYRLKNGFLYILIFFVLSFKLLSIQILIYFSTISRWSVCIRHIFFESFSQSLFLWCFKFLFWSRSIERKPEKAESWCNVVAYIKDRPLITT